MTAPKPARFPSVVDSTPPQNPHKHPQPAPSGYCAFFENQGFIMTRTNDAGDFVIRPTIALIGLVILLGAVGLLLFIVARQTGFREGVQQEKTNQIQERLDGVEKKADQANDFGIAIKEQLKKATPTKSPGEKK